MNSSPSFLALFFLLPHSFIVMSTYYMLGAVIGAHEQTAHEHPQNTAT